MKIVVEFLNMFDQDFLQMLILNSLGITFFLNYFYEYSLLTAATLSLGLYLSFFFGIIILAHVLSFVFRLFEKGPGVYK